MPSSPVQPQRQMQRVRTEKAQSWENEVTDRQHLLRSPPLLATTTRVPQPLLLLLRWLGRDYEAAFRLCGAPRLSPRTSSAAPPSMPFHETEKLIVPRSDSAVSVNDSCAASFRPSSDTFPQWGSNPRHVGRRRGEERRAEQSREERREESRAEQRRAEESSGERGE